MTQIKLTRKLYNDIRSDLLRDHDFAFERVGFAFGKIGNQGQNDTMVLIYDYVPVTDTHYLKSQYAGALIGPEAIRTAMQKGLDEHAAIFHVHLHPFPGRPRLSPTDRTGILPLIPSFRAINPDSAHGFILLSNDSVAGGVLLPGQERVTVVDKITVVGYPLEIIT